MPKIIPLGTIDPTLYGIAKRRATMMENGTMSFVGAFENELGRIVFKKVGRAVHAIVRTRDLIYCGRTFDFFYTDDNYSDFTSVESTDDRRFEYVNSNLPMVPYPFTGASICYDLIFSSASTGDFILVRSSVAFAYLTPRIANAIQYGTKTGTTGEEVYQSGGAPATIDTPSSATGITQFFGYGFANLSDIAGVVLSRSISPSLSSENPPHEYTVKLSRNGRIYSSLLTAQRIDLSRLGWGAWIITPEGRMIVTCSTFGAPEIVETYAAEIDSTESIVVTRRDNLSRTFGNLIFPSISSRFAAALMGLTESPQPPPRSYHWTLIRNDLSVEYVHDQQGTPSALQGYSLLTDEGLWFQHGTAGDECLAFYNPLSGEYINRQHGQGVYEIVASKLLQAVFLVTSSGLYRLTKQNLQTQDVIPPPFVPSPPDRRPAIRILKK